MQLDCFSSYLFIFFFACELDSTKAVLTKHTCHLACYFQPGALQIEQSEESDQGKYECVATNNDGTRYSAPANLYVRGRAAMLTALRCVKQILTEFRFQMFEKSVLLSGIIHG